MIDISALISSNCCFSVQAPALDIETAKFIIMRVGDKFCELVQQEKEAKNWAGEDGKWPNSRHYI